MNTDVESFLGRLRLQVAPTTFYRKRFQLQVFERYVAAQNKNLTEVTQADVQGYLSSLESTAAYRRQVCCVIRGLYAYRKTPDNPASHIVFKKETGRKLPNVPSQLVIEAIIGKLSSSDTLLSIRDRLIIELAYGSGLRRAELVKLDIEDVNLERKTVCVTGKGGKERIAPLTEKALEATREYLCMRRAYRGSLLVSARGKRLGSSSVYYILRDKAGIRPHLLRHACASHMQKNGCGIRVIQELLGHRRLSTTQIYTHINKTGLREVINRYHPGNSISCLKDNELYLK